jgi:hypothetical protein
MGVHYVAPDQILRVEDGQTLNISSQGALITAERQMPTGTDLDISVDWPVPLDRSCMLALHILATVVRSEKRQFAVRFRRYEFRTQGRMP